MPLASDEMHQHTLEACSDSNDWNGSRTDFDAPNIIRHAPLLKLVAKKKTPKGTVRPISLALKNERSVEYAQAGLAFSACAETRNH